MSVLNAQELNIVNEAKAILYRTLRENPTQIINTEIACDFIALAIGHEERENFLVVFLDIQHRVIHQETLFQGTLDSATVSPRVVMQQALKHNAAALIIAHNHPSGTIYPSNADKMVTTRIVEAGKLFDISVLDHIIVSGDRSYSFQANSIMPV